MKEDIRNRKDISVFVIRQYEKMLEDELMRPIFMDVAKIHLAEHFPILYDFWENVLFHAGTYKRNTMQIHLELHQLYRLKPIHFERWLQYFFEAIDENFEGPKADEAKHKGRTIAKIMQLKIDNIERERLEWNN